jgi:hypothetical protein
MSRILVIQPHRMLQQAFVVALFPEHEVRVVAEMPAAETLAAADLLIIDAMALRKGDALSPREIHAVQRSQVPVVWIDAQPPPAAVAKFVRLEPPLKRDELRAATGEGLRLGAAAPVARSKRAQTVAKTDATEPKPENAAASDAKQIIELVDVFEETPERHQNGAEARDKD